MRKIKAVAATSLAGLLLLSSLPVYSESSSVREGDVSIHSKDSGSSIRSTVSRNKQFGKLPYSNNVVVLRFEGPVKEEWKDAVEDLGVELGDYLPDFSFIAKLPDNKSILQKVKSLSFVDEVEKFHPSVKVSPDVMKELKENREVAVHVEGYGGKKGFEKTIKRVNAKFLSDETETSADMLLSSKDIEELIESDDVISITPVPNRVFLNDVAGDITESDRMSESGFKGKNQIVSVIDSGLDNGNVKTMHPDLRGQVKKLVPFGIPKDASDYVGHGTHVAGSIVGTGAMSDSEVKGTAPGAKLIFYSVADKDGRVSPKTNYYQLWTDAYKNGARINSLSIGSDSYLGGYTIHSQLADRFLWEHPDAISLVAAGNAADEFDEEWETISAPGTAKNVITVGASESYRPSIFNEDADNPDEVASFSSRGPTADGRIKPDLVAPGTAILSTRSILVSLDYYEDSIGAYGFLRGTSMATPITAGGIAQIREYLQSKGNANPSGALLKALAISGTQDIGESVLRMGYGRLNLLNSVNSTFLDKQDGIKTDDTLTYQVNITNTSNPFNATLVWTDYPASLIASRTLVNDLNIVVVSPSGKLFNGNDMFEAPYDDEVDNLNSVEQVYIPSPEKGTYTVTIKGYNIPMGPQPFALATNGEIKAKLVDETSVQATARLSKGTIKLTLKGKADASVKSIYISAPGIKDAKAKLSKGQFSFSKSVKLYGNEVEEITIRAIDKNGKEEIITVPVEVDLIDEDSIIITYEENGGKYTYEIQGELAGDVKSVYAVINKKMIPLTISKSKISGTFTADTLLNDILIAAVNSKDYYELVHMVKASFTSKEE